MGKKIISYNIILILSLLSCSKERVFKEKIFLLPTTVSFEQIYLRAIKNKNKYILLDFTKHSKIDPKIIRSSDDNKYKDSGIALFKGNDTIFCDRNIKYKITGSFERIKGRGKLKLLLVKKLELIR